MSSMKQYGGSYRDDSSFYRSLAQKISENLLFYVDGKPKFPNKDNGCTTSERVNDVKFSAESIIPKLNLEDYNFPPDYQLNDDEELDKIHFLMDELEYLSSSTKTITPPDNNMSIAVENDKLPIWSNMKPGSQAFLCNACGNYFTSLRAFDEHEINNHPNVFCSFTEVQLDQSIPANLLMWHHFSPTGLLRKCKVPQIASSSEPSIRCTKCHNKFTTAAELYQHIIDCSSSTIPSFSSTETTTPNSKAFNLPVQSNTAFSSSVLSVTVSSTSPSSISTSISSPSSISSSVSSSPSSTSKAVPSPISTSALSSGPSKLIPQTSPSTTLPARKGNATRSVNNDCPLSPYLNYNTRSSNKRKLQEPENGGKRRKMGRKFKNRDKPIEDKKDEQDEQPVTQSATNQDSKKTDTDIANVNYTPVHRAVRKFAMLNRRIRRRARYFCLNCPAVFSHHLTFAKHRNSCLPPEETDKIGAKKINDPSDSTLKNVEKNSPNKQVGKLKHRIGGRKAELKRKQKVPTKIVTRRASRQLKTGRNCEDDLDGGTEVNIMETNAKSNSTMSATRVTARKIVSKLRGRKMKRGRGRGRGRARVNRLEETESNAIVSDNNSDTEKTSRTLKPGRRRKIIIKRGRRKQQSIAENGQASSSTSTFHNSQNKEPIKHRVILSRRERRCPNCLRQFKYMGNFRKHIQAGCLGNVSQQVITANEKQSSYNVKKSKDQIKFDDSPALEQIELNDSSPPPPPERENHEDQSPASDNSSCSSSDMAGRYLSRQKSSVKTSEKKNDRKVDPWKVKQDYPQYAFKGSPAQFHHCPHCKRGFTYLANFRRHTIYQCPVKRKGDTEKLPVASTSANNSNETSKGACEINISEKTTSTNETSVKQSGVANVLSTSNCSTTQEENNDCSNVHMNGKNLSTSSTETPSIKTPSTKSPIVERVLVIPPKSPQNGQPAKGKTYACSVCKKEYEDLIETMKHQISHKLTDGDANGNNTNSNGSCKEGSSMDNDKDNKTSQNNLTGPKIYIYWSA